ncbi:hypothetical protein O1D97_09555 [Marinomonas sp. 15G1-11]|uniref:Uncharacterized protein n=1 Tax=Marinomonas phaeophyticola TaxID=3004091 RepID=A0ABT4JU20_9GAMM|nr:hypothetical protein [Marinomonas sp. 15G1-11]MCZ2721887.1 hypothetical protein [Marinomonas sp. 15G1-11]
MEGWRRESKETVLAQLLMNELSASIARNDEISYARFEPNLYSE